MPKARTTYSCRECGYGSARWLGRCPGCSNYNTLDEELQEPQPLGPGPASSPARASAVLLGDIGGTDEARIKTGIGELDRVLCGGIVQGSLVLIGGAPGIGKSTLLLQICEGIGTGGGRILYVSGEESAAQIKLRASRLGIRAGNLLVCAQTSMNQVAPLVREHRPVLLIIDSIQTMYRDDISSAPGSVAQVRECTSVLMRIAKDEDVSVIVVGHVTKDGALAGPRVLEHMVDAVLYFEGERRDTYRLLRCVKNRFGATNEIGVFEMRQHGLEGIDNPSAYMLSGRPMGVAGSVVTCSIEGTRPMLAEVQALVTPTNFGTPRRTATGMDYNRVVMLIAVLEKRAALNMANSDSYVNITGGMRIMEPALDASVLLALASSHRNRIVDPHTIVFGEVGLAGEMRAVPLAERRLAEAAKLGFSTCIMPEDNLQAAGPTPGGLQVQGASNVAELLELALF